MARHNNADSPEGRPDGREPSRDALESLWRTFSAPLKGFLQARTRSKADADDLLQEVFVRVHKRLPSLRNPMKLQGWIFSIARNAVIDHYRMRREQVPLDFELESGDRTESDRLDFTPVVRTFTAALPPQYRRPLIRHDLHGETMEEVALALNLSLPATKSRIRRARILLRRMLDACCRFEFDRRGRMIEAVPRGACDC